MQQFYNQKTTMEIFLPENYQSGDSPPSWMMIAMENDVYFRLASEQSDWIFISALTPKYTNTGQPL